MPHDLLNLPLLLQIVQGLPRQTSVDLQSIDQRRHRDEPVGLHVLVEFVTGGFVEDDGVVGFVLDWWLGWLLVWVLGKRLGGFDEKWSGFGAEEAGRGHGEARTSKEASV